jgi:hypothetical protein
MWGTRVLCVVSVQVVFHRHAAQVKVLVILAARQRSEAKELEQIDWQLFLDQLYVARDGCRGIGWESKNVAGGGDDFQRRQASNISRYSQILFWRFLLPLSDSGLIASRPINTMLQPARAAFSIKPGMR